MTDDARVRKRVERYFASNPDAGVTDALGALTLAPRYRGLVTEVRGEQADGDTDAPKEGHRASDVSHTDDPEREADESEDTGLHNPAEGQTSEADPGFKSGESDAQTDESGSWANIDYGVTESGVWPSTLLEREQWMGHVEKKPFAPWADRDASTPCTRDEHDADTTDECDCDVRWKWGYTGNYVDGETVAMAEDDPRLDGRAFLQREYDPFAYVDGDDVRDPETGEVHPAFTAILSHLGLTYGDVSQSGSGVHAMFRGELPEGVKEAAWQLDDEPFGANDDLPSIEIYARKRVCVATGEHVPGTPVEVREWNADVLHTILGANDQLPAPVSRPSDAHEDFDADEYDPDATGSDETTDDIRDLFAAIDRSDPKYVAEDTIVHRWNDDASTSDDTRAFFPTWGRTSNGTANVVNDKVWHDTGDEGGYGGPVVMALIDANEMSHRNASPRKATGALWWKGVEHLRELGYAIPKYDPPEDSDKGVHHSAKQCAPPTYAPEEFDKEQHWNELQTDRYQEWLDRNRTTMVWGDSAGAGKTTNAALAAAGRNRPHTVLFDKHEKAREFVTDPATPDDYFHLKGGEQPVHGCCMNAAAAADEGDTAYCPEHGHPSEWPRMCPIYERAQDDALRQAYEALVPAVGPRKAHHLLGICDDEEHPWHGEEGPWMAQFDGLENHERVVGVHEYQTLKTAVGDRDLILDESPRLLADDRRVEVEGLTRAANRLDDLDTVAGTPDGLGAFAAFARRVLDELVADDPVPLTEITPPDLDGIWESYREVKDPMSGAYVERDLKAETLAKIKIEYNESMVRRIQNDDWNGEPFCMNMLLAVAAEAGLNPSACREAVAVPATLDECPWCGSPVSADEGARCCASDDCDWHEEHHTITREDGPQARATGWMEADPDDLDPGQSVAICAKVLPPASAFPEPLVLDATAAPEKVAGMYGQPLADVDVQGDEPLALDGNLHLTQVVGGYHDDGGDDDTYHIGGQYHAGTIKQSESVQRRIQDTIDTVGARHECPLFGIQQKLIPLFQWPGVEGEDYELLHYGGARGLNREECDAVCCIGAPHPDMADIERQAALLAQNHPDLSVGGEEYSTRREDGELAAQPPVYRKLYYEDDHGDGLAVPTKAFSGLVGVLFREAREKELEQFIHRIRPLLADDELKHAYLLTDAPTALPVDDVVGFEELTDPLEALVPVSEGAVQLLRHGRDALVGGGPDGFRAAALVEERDDGTVANKVAGWHQLAQANSMDVTERTVRNWIDELENIGLLTAESYEQHAGVSYSSEISTLKSALQVLSSNAGFEVAAVRRLAAKIRASDGALEWLEWAEGVFNLSGDHCEWDPPPNPTG